MAYKPIDLSRCTYNGGSDWGIPEDTVGVFDSIDFNAGETWPDANKGVFGPYASAEPWIRDIDSSEVHTSVPATEAQRGLAFRYHGTGYGATGEVVVEQNVDFEVGYAQGYPDVTVYLKWLQPINFFKRKPYAVHFPDDDISGWQVGDTLTAGTSGAVGDIAFIGSDYVKVREPSLSGQNAWPEQAITNSRTGDTFNSGPYETLDSESTVGKRVMIWPGRKADGYEGHMAVTDEARSSGEGGSVGDGFLRWHNKYATTGGTGLTNYKLEDINDNGTVVEWWIRAKAETAEGAADAELQFYKRSGSTGDEVVKMVDRTNVTGMYDPVRGVNWQMMYLLGSDNNGYNEETTWHLLEMAVSTKKNRFPELEGL